MCEVTEVGKVGASVGQAASNNNVKGETKWAADGIDDGDVTGDTAAEVMVAGSIFPSKV